LKIRLKLDLENLPKEIELELFIPK